jgi:lysophospholipase L1-like esterase
VRAGVATAAAVAVLAGTTAAASAAPTPQHSTRHTAKRAAAEVRYVALGDSYSSGLGIPEQTDTLCGRSSNNYPSLVAHALDATSFTDVTCAGADTSDMTNHQDSAPPQLDALRPDTTLVTLGIGGNDLDLGGVITRCVLLGYLAPSGSPCKQSYTLLGTDEIGSRINATAPKIDAILKEIHSRSPQAKVLLVGYPVLFPDDGTACRETVALASGDFPWIRDKEKQFNTMLAQQANVYDASYVDAYGPSIGHDVCKPAGVRWIEPEDTAEAAGFHPNAAGHRSTADAVLASVTR